jgi:hypothetical protein
MWTRETNEQALGTQIMKARHHPTGIPEARRHGLWAALFLLVCGVSPADDASFPEATNVQRPWTRWWWLGSAVDKANLTRELEGLEAAGIGGAEICPIYGAKGAEERFLRFLSKPWVAMLDHTTAEARRLGLGIDLTTGTGWPFGGPGVAHADALRGWEPMCRDLRPGEAPDPGAALAAVAVGPGGERVPLPAAAGSGGKTWQAPGEGWKLCLLREKLAPMKVKRAAPGGEGLVLDPYSPAALGRYLAGFDAALGSEGARGMRGQFHDSFEYYGASSTTGMFDEFKARRGYDLRERLPELCGAGDPDLVARVRADYRETLSELHLAYLGAWAEWCQRHGWTSRNQAHGGPGDLLDCYAAVEIPETEIFRNVEERQLPMLQFASSAAHLSGRNLVSAESFTWLGEHFQVGFTDLKRAADLLFLGGVNHIFFHGIPYSPQDAGWPGWLF